MLYYNGKISYNMYDTAFLKKFGIDNATKMICDFYSQNSNDLPFIYDTNQLANFLDIKRKSLFYLLKKPNQNYFCYNITQSNGKLRKICEPNLCLKHIQNRILRGILNYMPVSKYSKAYRQGVTIKSNAKPHIGKRYLLKMDIKDFFGSISFTRVYGAAFNTHYFPKQIGTILTTICCYNDCLPQGAPTSPALSNLVMKNFDEILGAWCENKGVTYTRYCDDLTFSSDKPLYHVYEKAKSMLEGMDFEINNKKTKFITSANRQEVTGITVNEKLSISSDYKRNLRQEIYYALKYGPEDALERLNRNDYDNPISYLYHLLGCVSHVLSVEPNNKWFNDAKHRLNNLILFKN